MAKVIINLEDSEDGEDVHITMEFEPQLDMDLAKRGILTGAQYLAARIGQMIRSNSGGLVKTELEDE